MPPLFALSELTISQWAVALNTLGLATIAISGIVSTVLANRKADKAAKKVEEVKDALAETADGNGKKLDAIHTLVNSNFGVQLRLNMVVTRKLANSADATPEDVKIADESERLYDQHMAAQAVVDAQPGTDDEKAGR